MIAKYIALAFGLMIVVAFSGCLESSNQADKYYSLNETMNESSSSGNNLINQTEPADNAAAKIGNEKNISGQLTGSLGQQNSGSTETVNLGNDSFNVDLINENDSISIGEMI
jgi:hypothetical protein